MTFADTHCHIHSDDYGLDGDETVKSAQRAGVTRLLCVGTDAADSAQAVKFVAKRSGCYASIGLHPHEARHYKAQFPEIESLATEPNVVAIGECGLDYYYDHSPRPIQRQVFEMHLELASQHKLPLIFHVREAFEDFWPIVDTFPGVRGVVHSFSATRRELEAALSRDFYIGLNGIMTFTKNDEQLAAARAVPLEKLVLETDAPFLTPEPLRGKINEPRYVVRVAESLAQLRGESLEVVAKATTSNVKELFGV